MVEAFSVSFVVFDISIYVGVVVCFIVVVVDISNYTVEASIVYVIVDNGVVGENIYGLLNNIIDVILVAAFILDVTSVVVVVVVIVHCV